jgi:hypothetical protein
MSNPVTPRYATAIHESSHAVCALSFGLPVDRLSIRADGLAGVCSFRHPRATPEQIVSVFVAGVLGERLIAPRTDIEVANTDAREAAKFARGLDLKAIVAKTRLRIYNLWTEIAGLAEAIDKRGSLDAGEIARAARMPPLSWLSGF